MLMLYSLLLKDLVSFRVELPPVARAGEPVPVVLRLTNRTERPLTLALQGRPLAFDVTVTGPDGAIVWRRVEGAVVQSVLAVRTLAPAEGLTFEAVWDGRRRDGSPAPPGRYLVAGKLLTDTREGLATRPTPLELLAHP
jgi:intracellular proteinase inhibitor BsuPI